MTNVFYLSRLMSSIAHVAAAM